MTTELLFSLENLKKEYKSRNKNFHWERIKEAHEKAHWDNVTATTDRSQIGETLFVGLFELINRNIISIFLYREIRKYSTCTPGNMIRENSSKIWMQLTPEEEGYLIVDTSFLYVLSDFMCWLKAEISEETALFVE